MIKFNKWMNATVEERFWYKVNITDNLDECWIWIPGTHSGGGGYGSFQYKKNDVRWAHRVSWEITFGDIPDELLVLHKCDNRLCVNPNHLWLGTYDDNNKDAANKGRTCSGDKHYYHLYPELIKRGEQIGNSKLLPKQVIEIRRLYSNGGINQMKLAEMFETDNTNISMIVNGKTWKHLLPL